MRREGPQGPEGLRGEGPEGPEESRRERPQGPEGSRMQPPEGFGPEGQFRPDQYREGFESGKFEGQVPPEYQRQFDPGMMPPSGEYQKPPERTYEMYERPPSENYAPPLGETYQLPAPQPIEQSGEPVSYSGREGLASILWFFEQLIKR